MKKVWLIDLFTFFFFFQLLTRKSTGSQSSKYEHRRTSALLRNIQNIRICMGKKTIVSVKKKNSLPYLKCVLRLSCVVHGPIYGRFMGFYVNGFLSTSKKVYLYTTNQIFSTYHLSSFPMVSLSVWFSYRNSPISSCSCLHSSSNLACSASKFAFSSFTAFNTNMTSGTVWWL